MMLTLMPLTLGHFADCDADRHRTLYAIVCGYGVQARWLIIETTPMGRVISARFVCDDCYNAIIDTEKVSA